ncbi:MAG: sigma-70 family RNA polymerase sigma factor [Candidatus Lokiarchaeota archaeon]|nr:sigma-70 family RNA polymerase sigma factor [Candidatus Lokiarchaeota archaeon]
MSENHQDDSNIVELLKKDRETGCRLLVKKYGNLFLTKALNGGLIHEDAVSTVNDTFLKVIDKIHKFESKDSKSFFNWMFTILINTIRDYRKHCILKQEIKLDFFDESNFEMEEFFDVTNTIEKSVVQKIKEDFYSSGISEDSRKKLIVEAFNKLPEIERVIFYCYCNGYNLNEISEYTGISVTNLKVKLFRIRNKFVEEINKNIPINKKEAYEQIKKIH